MSDNNDLRLIEDYLPIEAISKEASREKSVRKGHISTLHLWWARRPLVACRAAVYGALVSANRWVKDIDMKNLPADPVKAEAMKNGAKKGLNRKAAKDFVTKLCRYPKTNPTKASDIKIKQETEQAIVDAQRHILEAHADRLTAELKEAKKTDKFPAWVEEFDFQGDKVIYDDIIANRAPRPRVLDMFAGGGAIPLEALRLGCEAYALDLNPVAHIIELCTLVYPQKYGKPDPNARGMTGPKNDKGETTWGGLTPEVRYWGNWVLDRVRKEIGDIYPPIPDPEVWEFPSEIAFNSDVGEWHIIKPGKAKSGVKIDTLTAATTKTYKMFKDDQDENGEDTSSSSGVQFPRGFLQPVAYLWTRTVHCKNPSCTAIVPLVRQTWLCKKNPKPATKRRAATPGRYVALKMHAPKGGKQVTFEVVESQTESGLGFDPEEFSSGGNATCPFCGTVCDNEYIKSEGSSSRIDAQLMGVACLPRPGETGKTYVAQAESNDFAPDMIEVRKRIKALCDRSDLSEPSEQTPDHIVGGGGNCQPYGFTTWDSLFNPRQLLSLLASCFVVREARMDMTKLGHKPEIIKAVAVYLAALVDRLADFNSTLCVFNYTGGRGVVHTFGRQALPMVWDYAETNIFNPEGASWPSAIADVPSAFKDAPGDLPATVRRGSATSQKWEQTVFDAVITDPPYYDNIGYALLADFFYVWLKRSIGDLFPEHFSTDLSPKKAEAIADPTMHQGGKAEACQAYEKMMLDALILAASHLKPMGQLAVVYAHKTTLGWATLVDAMRRAGLNVTEAWPLDTEKTGRLSAQETAALASSIFLIARKRYANSGVGNYEDDVQPKLQQIVRERVETLWGMGIAGADLVIACVGAGLRAFTKYERVEYANGEAFDYPQIFAKLNPK